MERELIRELIIIFTVNASLYLIVSGYIDHKLHSKNKKKRGFIE